MSEMLCSASLPSFSTRTFMVWNDSMGCLDAGLITMCAIAGTAACCWQASKLPHSSISNMYQLGVVNKLQVAAFACSCVLFV